MSKTTGSKRWESLEFQLRNKRGVANDATRILRKICEKLEIKSGGMVMVFSGHEQNHFAIHVLLYSRPFNVLEVTRWAIQILKQ